MPIIAGRASAAYGAGFAAVTTVPFAPVGSFDALGTVTVGAGGLSSITFAGIPQTGYSHLQIRGIGRSDAASGLSWLYLTFNGDNGTNYASHYLQGDGSSRVAGNLIGSGSNTENRLGDFPRANAASGIFGGAIIDILDYNNTNKNKISRLLGGVDRNGSGVADCYSGVWLSTASVYSITMTPQTSNWVEYSSFTLYGVK
jgi:hypothetical protein